MPRMTLDTLAALFIANQKVGDERHEENKGRLDAILEQAKMTNGRVNDHETRLKLIESRPHIAAVAASGESSNERWKLIGYGIGVLFFGAWGVVEAIHWCFEVLTKVGSAVTGK